MFSPGFHPTPAFFFGLAFFPLSFGLACLTFSVSCARYASPVVLAASCMLVLRPKLIMPPEDATFLLLEGSVGSAP